MMLANRLDLKRICRTELFLLFTAPSDLLLDRFFQVSPPLPVYGGASTRDWES